MTHVRTETDAIAIAIALLSWHLTYVDNAGRLSHLHEAGDYGPMPMQLAPDEPAAGPWRVESLTDFMSRLRDDSHPLSGRPFIVAIDGRSSGGKTTLTRRLCAAFPATAVVHTDDIAWAHSRFGWTDLMINGVLTPVRNGLPVSYRPTAWQANGRAGSVEVPGGCELLIVEGVGAGRRDLSQLLDAVVWVQADARDVEQRGLARIGQPGGSRTLADMQGWMTEEIPFVADQRTWERADVIVNGTPELAHDPATHIVIAPALPAHESPAD